MQQLRRLGVHVSRQTVKNVIVEAGLGPVPGDHPDTWHKFLKRHAETLWQCDFACKKRWTVKGLVDVYFMVFTIAVGTTLVLMFSCAIRRWQRISCASGVPRLPATFLLAFLVWLCFGWRLLKGRNDQRSRVRTDGLRRTCQSLLQGE